MLNLFKCHAVINTFVILCKQNHYFKVLRNFLSDKILFRHKHVWFVWQKNHCSDISTPLFLGKVKIRKLNANLNITNISWYHNRWNVFQLRMWHYNSTNNSKLANFTSFIHENKQQILILGAIQNVQSWSRKYTVCTCMHCLELLWFPHQHRCDLYELHFFWIKTLHHAAIVSCWSKLCSVWSGTLRYEKQMSKSWLWSSPAAFVLSAEAFFCVGRNDCIAASVWYAKRNKSSNAKDI